MNMIFAVMLVNLFQSHKLTTERGSWNNSLNIVLSNAMLFPQISYTVPSLESFLKSSTKYSKTETTCVADNSLLQ